MQIIDQNGKMMEVTEVSLYGNSVISINEDKQRIPLGYYSSRNKAVSVFGKLNRHFRDSRDIPFAMPNEMMRLIYEGMDGRKDWTYQYRQWLDDYFGCCQIIPSNDSFVWNVIIDGVDILEDIRKMFSSKDLLFKDVVRYFEWKNPDMYDSLSKEEIGILRHLYWLKFRKDWNQASTFEKEDFLQHNHFLKCDHNVELIWDSLEDVLFYEDGEGRMHLFYDWFLFEKGTEREEIWHWFDKNHSKGVHYLLYERESV